MDDMAEPVLIKEVGMTAHEWAIATSQARAAGMSRNQWLSYVVLTQEHDPAEVAKRMASRRGRGRVWPEKGKQQ